MIDFDRTRNARITISNVISIRKNLNEMGDYNRIFPSQPGLTKAEDPQKYPFVMDKSVYNSTKPYLTDTISINKIGTMRGKSIASLEINPVIYHPAGKYVDIIVSMNIFIEYSEVYRTGNNSKNYYSYDFDRFLSKGLINYDYDDVIPEFSLEPVGMVIVSDTAFKSSLQPLVKWKAKKGFKVTELYIGENGLKKDFHDIKDTLTYIYTNSTQDNPAPTYLMLAGDLDYIPPSEGTDYLTDMYYAEFDGNYDFIPDMFTGRLPASDTNQMKAIVDKIIQYESFMFGDTIKHFRKAVALTGLEEGNITFMDGQVNYATGYFND
ncbi:MAG TPA: hypothetical protein DEQ09_07650, partial [Bacteroidales bacterium]|nr:hypothetical protein [Bacteroidales bacterium]